MLMKEGNHHLQACSTKPELACRIGWSVCFNVLIILPSCCNLSSSGVRVTTTETSNPVTNFGTGRMLFVNEKAFLS